MRFRAVLLLIAMLLASGTAGADYWLRYRDPLLVLPRPEHGLSVVGTEKHLENGRMIEHVVLHSVELGNIGFAINLPDPMPQRKMPILVVLGGLGTGENNIRYLTDCGNNAIIGYDWPVPVHFYGGGWSTTHLPAVYKRVVGIPAQVASAIDWASRQPWADGQRISLLGFSLGAVASPAVQDIVEHDGQHIGWTILAYGGAPFGDLIATSPHLKPIWIRPILAASIDLLLGPLQPTRHLAHLSGHFLILEGRDDSLVTQAARERLRDAVPEPKTVVSFDGDHMGIGPDKMALLQQIIAVSRKWLLQEGAIDPV